MPIDPREQQLWGLEMPPLFDLDYKGNVKPMSPEKLQPWTTKDKIKERMNQKWTNSLGFLQQLIMSFVSDENEEFYNGLIMTPFLSRECGGFFLNLHIWVEARLINPLLWDMEWEYSFYSVIYQIATPTHLHFTLMHSQGEYIEMTLPVYIQDLYENRHIHSYAWLKTGLPMDSQPYWSTFLCHERIKTEHVFVASNMDC